MADPDFPFLSENQYFEFPDLSKVSPEGILASGGNLSPGMLLSAYSQGAFPWYSEGEPILWWNPDPRCVLFPSSLHVSRRTARRIRTCGFVLRSDSCFDRVISHCANIKRKHEEGTWINPDIIDSYTVLHEKGWAHSVEVFDESGSTLIGGLYGISMGRVFFGESMFSSEDDASKIAFFHMVNKLEALDIELIDCQISTPHLLSLGAEEIPRSDYMELLADLLDYPDLKGKWNLFQ